MSECPVGYIFITSEEVVRECNAFINRHNKMRQSLRDKFFEEHRKDATETRTRKKYWLFGPLETHNVVVREKLNSDVEILQHYRAGSRYGVGSPEYWDKIKGIKYRQAALSLLDATENSTQSIAVDVDVWGGIKREYREFENS